MPATFTSLTLEDARTILAAATKKAKKNNGSKMSVGFRYADLALAVSVGATVYFS